MSDMSRNTVRAIVTAWMDARTLDELVDEVSSPFGLTAADIIEDSMADGWPVHDHDGLAVHCRHPRTPYRPWGRNDTGNTQAHGIEVYRRPHRWWCVGPNPLHKVSR